MSAFDLVLSALAGWRLAYMLAHEDGPLAVFAVMRYRIGLRPIVTKDARGNPVTRMAALNTVAQLFSCVWCLSVWTVALVSIPWWPVEVVRFLLAAAAVAALVHETAQRLKHEPQNTR